MLDKFLIFEASFVIALDKPVEVVDPPELNRVIRTTWLQPAQYMRLVVEVGPRVDVVESVFEWLANAYVGEDFTCSIA